ncbi:substrate-binding domain-containing protein [Paenibacillus pasadenensis]|uniref:Ribose ABC transporter, periplasmic ribose-binding protein rbsB n=1 Tax=Paenibacillus pasadenensis TaxID=217090 RepID=A0A2N5N4D2_9BACL|nr:substrate-binding domain-containing protein [Paenibacillus pasadenensis]PLT45191.1 Ribose ABC transporter, periplasmic ribose-binding protein rbsB [Paenibacillus pasadenensis]
MGSKKLWLPLLLLLFAALVVWNGLKRSEPADAGGGIIVILQTKDVNSSYWQTVRSGAMAAAKELNVALELLGPTGAEAAEEQKELLRGAIAARPEAIVLAPIAEERLSEELDACRKAGIKLIVIDTPLLSHPYDSYVSSDHVEEGRVAADMLAPDKRKKPVYAFITSDDDSVVASQRRQGVLEKLPPGEAFSLGTIDVGKSEEQAYRTVKSLTVAYPGMNGIVALTDVGVSGAARALEDQGLSHSVKLIGFDSSLPEIQLLERGRMHALIVQNPFNMGYLGVETASAVMQGRKRPQWVDIPSATVTSANMYEPENQKLLFPFVS